MILQQAKERLAEALDDLSRRAPGPGCAPRRQRQRPPELREVPDHREAEARERDRGRPLGRAPPELSPACRPGSRRRRSPPRSSRPTPPRRRASSAIAIAWSVQPPRRAANGPLTRHPTRPAALRQSRPAASPATVAAHRSRRRSSPGRPRPTPGRRPRRAAAPQHQRPGASDLAAGDRAAVRWPDRCPCRSASWTGGAPARPIAAIGSSDATRRQGAGRAQPGVSQQQRERGDERQPAEPPSPEPQVVADAAGVPGQPDQQHLGAHGGRQTQADEPPATATPTRPTGRSPALPAIGLRGSTCRSRGRSTRSLVAPMDAWNPNIARARVTMTTGVPPASGRERGHDQRDQDRREGVDDPQGAGRMTAGAGRGADGARPAGDARCRTA